MKNSPSFLSFVLHMLILCGFFGWGYWVGWHKGVHAKMIEAWECGVAVPEKVDGRIKYRWVDPHLLEEIPPPLPE